MLSLMLLCQSMWGQESRREIASPVTPADSKANDKNVPEVRTIPTQFERVLLLRFKYDTELLSGLEKAVQ
jgi:hypothetical protein